MNNHYALKGFLMETENHFYIDGEDLAFFCLVPFYKLFDFVSIIGEEWFSEEPIKCNLKSDYLAIELKEIFEESGFLLKDFKSCFNKDEFKEFESYIKNFDN